MAAVKEKSTVKFLNYFRKLANLLNLKPLITQKLVEIINKPVK